MTIKTTFIRGEKTVKSTAAAIGTLAFFLFPGGMGASIVAGATAAIGYAAYKAIERKMEEAAITDSEVIDVIDEVLDDKEFRSVAHPATFYIVSGAIIAWIPGSVMGFIVGAALIYAARKALWTLYSNGGRVETTLARDWVFNLTLDGKKYRFAI